MAVVEHQIGAVGDTVDRPFAAVLVEDGQFARAAGDHATAALILDHAQIAELGLAVRRRVEVRLLVELRRAADVEGPHRQLGARLADRLRRDDADRLRSEEHTSELQSLMRTSYAVFCLKKKKKTQN